MSGDFKEPEGPARCSVCKYRRYVYSPQPGVNWNRCAATKNEAGEMESCSRNYNRQCREYKRKTILGIPCGFPVPFRWWEPEL